jgi:membrane protease YdiL (CAAX protease family)
LTRLRSLGLLLAFAALFFLLVRFTSTLLAALVAGWLLLALVEKRPLGDLGFRPQRKAWLEILIGLAIPTAALLLVCVPLILLGAWQYRADDGTWTGWLSGCAQLLVLLVVPAAGEEALFRGYPFQKLVELVGPVIGTLGASALFAVAHGNNPGIGVFAMINIFLAGVMLSIAYLRTGSLWFASAVHLGWNWQIGGPLDLPISGLELFDTPLYQPSHLGSAWLTGAEFGPEGGIAGLLALALVTAGVWWFTKTRALDHA